MPRNYVCEVDVAFPRPCRRRAGEFACAQEEKRQQRATAVVALARARRFFQLGGSSVCSERVLERCRGDTFAAFGSLGGRGRQAANARLQKSASRVQVLHTISINVSPDMRRTLINPTLNSKFEDVANGRSNTLAAGLTQLLHDWEFLFGCATSD